jgi:hypothetical protein
MLTTAPATELSSPAASPVAAPLPLQTRPPCTPEANRRRFEQLCDIYKIPLPVSPPAGCCIPSPVDEDAALLLQRVAEQPHIFQSVLSFGAVADLCRWRAVSRDWRTASSAPELWAPRCESLWADKVFVPADARALLGASHAFEAYRRSVEDSRRSYITAEELCSVEWYHRMKGWSGEDWTANDPWWNGQTPRKKRFEADGTTVNLMLGVAADECERRSRSADSRWRFVKRCIGHAELPGAFVPGQQGAFIRHSRGGREFPTAFVQRWPKNWGFILNQCWGFSASFPLPPKGEEPELEDEGEIVQSVSVETQSREARLFNTGRDLPDPNIERAPSAAAAAASGSSVDYEHENDTDDDFDDSDDEAEEDPGPDSMVSVQIGGRQYVMSMAELQAVVSSMEASGDDSDSSDAEDSSDSDGGSNDDDGDGDSDGGSSETGRGKAEGGKDEAARESNASGVDQGEGKGGQSA